MTYKEIVYIILDELKQYSDDSNFNELHVRFLCNKYRAFLLKKNYTDIKKDIPSSNYQTICLDLEIVPTIKGDECAGSMLRSKDKIPSTLEVGNPMIYPKNYLAGTHITYISMERLRFVGYNKWLKNIIYCAKGPDDYLYFKSWNPQHMYLERVIFEGIFENIEDASELSCSEEDSKCDIMDEEFPLEDALVPLLIQAVVQELAPKTIVPEDPQNNARDDKANLATYIANNTKSNLAKQLS